MNPKILSKLKPTFDTNLRMALTPDTNLTRQMISLVFDQFTSVTFVLVSKQLQNLQSTWFSLSLLFFKKHSVEVSNSTLAKFPIYSPQSSLFEWFMIKNGSKFVIDTIF